LAGGVKLDRNLSWNETIKLILGDLKFYSKTNSILINIATMLFSLEYQTVALYRTARWSKKSKLFRPLAIIYLYWQQLISGCHINPQAEIGRHLNLPHPTGIIIGAQVRIGNNVTIYQNVTLGSHGHENSCKNYPIIEDDVIIYAGAVIIGGVVIGKGSIIGANAVVLSDIPTGTTAVGIPAKIIKPKHRNPS
jgi:serine O-acetyltransferase